MRPLLFLLALPALYAQNGTADGATRENWPKFASDLRTHFGSFSVSFTEAPGHARELAAEAAKQGTKLIIACGGDGTISEVANGILASGRDAELGILPSGTGGDFRRSATDDQAAQVLVAFADRRILTYIWDSSAPKGVWQSASSIPLVRIFALVCRSGREELNQWLPETHNLGEDYRKVYGRPPVRVKGIRLQINSQHTGSSAESYFGDISFRSAQQ